MLRLSRIHGFNLLSKYHNQIICQCFQYSSNLNQESNVDSVGTSSYQKNNDHLEFTEDSHEMIESVQRHKIVSSLIHSASSKFKLDLAFKALDIMSSWSDSENFDYKEYLDDDNYSKLSLVFDKEGRNQNPKNIISALKNLSKIGVPSNNFLVESLQHDLLWILRNSSISSILSIVEFQVDHQETEKQKEVLEQAIGTLSIRWNEIFNPRDICSTYHLSKHLPDRIMKHIDDSVVENAVNMTLDNLHKVLVAISISGRRPKPALQTLVYYISKKIEPLSPKQVSGMLYALNQLNLPDEMVLIKLSNDFRLRMSDIDSAPTVRTVALCMGQMRWRDEKLLDALAQWMVDHVDVCRPSDLAILIITLAVVSYTPSNIQEFLSVCISRLNPQILTKSEWVDFIWSLMVLERASKEQIVSVLNPSFIESVSSSDKLNIGMHLKLLHINAIANSFFSHAGPTLQKNLLADSQSITRSCSDLSLHNHVLSVLKKFLPFPKYLNVNLITNMGFTVDAEVIVDKYCKPLPIHEYSTAFGEIESIKPLPTGAQRLAIKIWTFKDYTLGSRNLTGRNSLIVRLLNKKGYKVVQIPHHSINKKNTLVQNIHYLENRIKETVEQQ